MDDEIPTPIIFLIVLVLLGVGFAAGAMVGEHGGTDVVFRHDCKTMLHGEGHGDLCIKDGRVVGHM